MNKLPQYKQVDRHVLESYGGLYLLSLLAGFKNVLYYFKWPTFWVHGWHSDENNISIFCICPDIFIHGKSNFTFNYLVARKSQEIFLKQKGYINAKAIGLPIVYLPEKKIERQKNTLLVMPVHSNNSIHNNWQFDNYVQSINSVRNQFKKVVICIHPLCIRDGFWVNEFKKYDYEIVEGAIGNDKNALLRIQILLSSFEYVTTNGFGSHWAYASFLGAKFSVFGNFAAYLLDEKEIENDQIMKDNIESLYHVYKVISEDHLKNKYPSFFCHPKEATQHIDWGKYEVGYDNKLSKEEVLELFGWKNFYWTPKGWKYWISENSPEGFKKVVRSIINIFR
jgi:hypothetical protein